MATMVQSHPSNGERSGRSLITLLALLVLGIAAVIALIFIVPNLNPAIPPANAPAEVNPAAGFAPDAAAAAIEGDERLLVWVGVGGAPGEHSASEPGQLALLDAVGEVTTVLDLPQQTTRVVACGDEATSPDGRFFAFFVGIADMGTLYVMDGSDAPTAVDEMNTLGCVGGGTFQWSPDSARFAYIAYEGGAAASEFPDGFLYIYDAAGMAQAGSAENVVAFDITDDSVAYLQFFTNDRNEADEAAVLLWDGSSAREVATLRPEEDCRFSSGEIGIAPNGQLVAVMGHRCRGVDGTRWQFYVIDPESRSANKTLEDATGGAFASTARSNNVWFSPDGATAYFTVPDGIALNSVALWAVNLESGNYETTNSVNRGMLVAKYDNFPYQWADNAPPVVSNDGRWLAFVVANPGAETMLNVLDLSAPDVAPITISAGSSGDNITWMSFTEDSSRLLFVSGGNGSADNSLSALDLETGGDFRVSRGKFGRGAVAPAGDEVMVMDWKRVEDQNEPPYLTLAVFNVADSSSVVLFEGAEIVDGAVENQTFAYPLAWR